MSWNTVAELKDLIGLTSQDFDEARYQEALDTAHSEITFRMGKWDDTSYPETSPFDTTKFNASIDLAKSAEWRRAGSILYNHFGQVELQFGQSGTPTSTPDLFQIGAFTPEKNVQAMEYIRRGDELQRQYEQIISLIMPNTNLPIVSVASGRSDFTDDATFWGSDAWA